MKSAAFFDLDGTMIPPPSLERRFLGYLHWHRRVGVRQWTLWAARFFARAWFDPRAAIDGNKSYLAGVPCSMLDGWITWLRRWPIPFFPGALARLEWHAVQGHRIFLVTGSLQPLAEAVAKNLPVSVVTCATELDSSEGRWTGRLANGSREAVSGPAKAGVVAELARKYGLDLTQSYAYGDSFQDRWMLEAVGHPLAVNPSRWLARLARRRAWPMASWSFRATNEETCTTRITAPTLAFGLLPEGPPSIKSAQAIKV